MPVVGQPGAAFRLPGRLPVLRGPDGVGPGWTQPPTEPMSNTAAGPECHAARAEEAAGPEAPLAIGPSAQPPSTVEDRRPSTQGPPLLSRAATFGAPATCCVAGFPKVRKSPKSGWGTRGRGPPTPARPPPPPAGEATTATRRRGHHRQPRSQPTTRPGPPAGRGEPAVPPAPAGRGGPAVSPYSGPPGAGDAACARTPWPPPR